MGLYLSLPCCDQQQPPPPIVVHHYGPPTAAITTTPSPAPPVVFHHITAPPQPAKPVPTPNPYPYSEKQTWQEPKLHVPQHNVYISPLNSESSKPAYPSKPPETWQAQTNIQNVPQNTWSSSQQNQKEAQTSQQPGSSQDPPRQAPPSYDEAVFNTKEHNVYCPVSLAGTHY